MVQTFVIQTVDPRFGRARAIEVLRLAYGPEAQFREGQAEAVEAIGAPGARLLLVQATGWGKSVVYFIAAALAKESGPTLVVSPLIALMRNQVETAQRFGLRAGAIHSENREEWDALEKDLEHERLDVLFVSPERLRSTAFRQTVLDPLQPRLALVVIDEAHCISEWGHDFRPDYRTVLRHLDRISPSTPLLAATATATLRVEEDIKSIFGPFLEVRRGRLVRPSLRLVCAELPGKADRLAWLATYLPRLAASGIVYVLTVFDAKEVSRWLASEGIEAPAYHAELPGERRIALEAAFSANQVKALVATTALGMGYDKADVGFVVHYQTPASLVAYYQQIGRAGRALDRAQAVLLAGSEDDAIAESLIDSARPPARVFEETIRLLGSGPMRFEEIARPVGVSGSMVRHALDILEAGQGVWRDESGAYHLDPPLAREELLRGDRVRELRRAEYQQLRAYVRSSSCRMRAIAQALGDPAAEDCGICDRYRPIAPFSLGRALLDRASEFGADEPKVLVPRTVLPLPVLENRKRIPQELRNRPGIVLGVYSRDKWGELAKIGKYVEHRFADALVEAAGAAIEAAPDRPTWLTWIPSRRSGVLSEFAQRLAARLGIGAVESLEWATPTHFQKTSDAHHEPFINVWESLQARSARPGVCLLLDDIVDSGWTLTIAGLRLRLAGSGPILPLALAAASSSRIKFQAEAYAS